ncbi:hypothetical protein LX64_03852 [Chitinophaga skermanii]|uniref:DUF4199 domain-containing protein n=1 Tax=Chitinophaga skermanii TaxID=331697 RepID=A0A327QCD5_9BACT|nr:hypothetical protein [Chitinophaga skermanii]RAJ01635.1 hypothetical protein LX64_03852 [Chitinophaga skermanii]
MENSVLTTYRKQVIVASLLITGLSLLFMLLFILLNQYGNPWIGYVGNLVVFLGVLFSILVHRKEYGGLSLGHLFTIGIATAIISTVLIAIVTLILNVTIGNTMPETADQTRNRDIFMWANVVFSNIFLGLLASVLAAVVVKRNQKTGKGR